MPDQVKDSLWPMGRRTSVALAQELERNKTLDVKKPQLERNGKLDVEKPLPALPKRKYSVGSEKAMYADRPVERKKYQCECGPCVVM
jgi:hypothetical protein